MKTCDEMMNSLFERRKQYVAAQRKKKKMLASGAASLCAVSLLGGGVWYLGQPRHNAPVTVTPNGDMQTTTAADDITTTADGTTTTGTVVKDTTAPSKTEPPATTTTAPAPTKLLITADEEDTTGNFDDMTLSKNGKYITPLLQQTMERYKGVDVVYAVIVGIPPMMQDWDEDFWNDTEELLRWREEYRNAYDAFYEEAKQLNPSWDDGNTNHIKVWTDTMRAKYEYVLRLIDERDRLKDQYQGPYVESVLKRRFDALKELCDAEPIDVACHYQGHFDIYHHEYYVKLTAESINALAEQGGYTFRLSLPDQRDYGDWDIDE